MSVSVFGCKGEGEGKCECQCTGARVSACYRCNAEHSQGEANLEIAHAEGQWVRG